MKSVRLSLSEKYEAAVQQEVQDLCEVFDIENALTMLGAYEFDAAEEKLKIELSYLNQCVLWNCL